MSLYVACNYHEVFYVQGDEACIPTYGSGGSGNGSNSGHGYGSWDQDWMVKAWLPKPRQMSEAEQSIRRIMKDMSVSIDDASVTLMEMFLNETAPPDADAVITQWIQDNYVPPPPPPPEPESKKFERLWSVLKSKTKH